MAGMLLTGAGGAAARGFEMTTTLLTGAGGARPRGVSR